MTRPKVSVCIPVYNMEKYLEECLDSLVNQTLKDIEIICVDDGSTDKSPVILERYAKKYKNIKVIHQKNMGLGPTRDKGVVNARGEFIGFVDADDKVDEDMYETLYTLATKNDAKVAFCNVELFPHSIKTDKRVWYNPFQGRVDGEFLYKNGNPCNKIFHRDLFNKTKMRFKKNDGLCILLIIYAGKKIVTIDKKMYKYRVGHSSMSSHYDILGFLNNTETLREIKDEVISSGSIGNDMKETLSFLIIESLIQTMAVSVIFNDKKIYQKVRDDFKKCYYKNKYLGVLKREYGCKKYFAMIHILPNNFALSRFLICNVLGGNIK